MPATEYVRALRDCATDLLREGKPPTYDATLTAVTLLAYDHLRDTDTAASDLAATCAFLAPQPVRVAWLTAAAGLPAELAACLAGPLPRSRLLASVTRTSLARLDDDGLTMHRLTQAIIRTSLEAPLATAAHARAEAVITASRPGDADLPANWPDWARHLPHLLALDPGLSGSPGLRAVAYDAAWYLTASGNHAEALDLGARLHEQWRDRLGADDSHTLRIAGTVGQALRSLGRYGQARQVDEDALDRRRRLSGDDDQRTLSLAHNLADDLRGLREYRAARALDEDTLARYRRVLREDHPSTLNSANNLAADLRRLGEHHAARALDEDTLARRRRVLGEDHPHTLHSANNLAEDLRALGEYQAARRLDEENLARFRRVLGENHPHTRISAQNLAADLRALQERPG
jgi:hypothetical protein